jgi:dihydrofolate reductase
MLKLNLIDELRLSIHPIILGQGKPLFHPSDVRKLFHLVEVIRFRSGVIQVIYQKKEA